MPADRQIVFHPGRRGLNLRDHPAALHPEELADALNWQIDQLGALVKRLGFDPWGIAAPAAILELTVYEPAGGTPLAVAYCANGKVYTSPDGDPWTEIATGLSTTAIPQFVQYLDNLYWINGVDELRQWTGTGSATAITAAPLGEYLALWRNRLWIGRKNEREVHWSAAGDPTDWSNTDNVVSFPEEPPLTAIATAPSIGTEADTGDGVLVFTERSMHRIVDDSDNAAGVAVGGANVLVDVSNGCVSWRSIAAVRGRVYMLGRDGVYSTDGHQQLRLETRKLGPLFAGSVSYGTTAIGLGFKGRYYLAFTPLGQAANSRVLELYLDHPADNEGLHPWMAHDVPARAWTRFPGDILLMADASTGDTARVRRLFNGGADADAASDELAINARARTGGIRFEVEQPKLLRRVFGIGFGTLFVSAFPDLDEGEAETVTLNLGETSEDPLWDGGVWDGGVWDGATRHTGQPAYFRDVIGRLISLEIVEVGEDTTASHPTLGLGTVTVGGAALHYLHATIAPLDIP